MQALSTAQRRITHWEARGGSVSEPHSATAGSVGFADFYSRTRDDIYRTVLLATRHPERAEDAVHEAYARALSDWPRLASHPNPSAWVARVALNQATSW